MRRVAGKRHLLSAKSVKQRRSMGQDKAVDTKGVIRTVKAALPCA